VLRGVRLQLGPVERDVAQPGQPQPQCQHHRLLEHRRERFGVVTPKARECPIVRLTAPGQIDERRLLARQARQLPRRPHPVQVAPRQDPEQRVRVVRLLALRTRRDHEVPQVYPLHQIHKHMDRVLGRQRVLQANHRLDIRRVRFETIRS